MDNPLELTELIKREVCKNSSKKYYRFRKTKFYGGCATADCLGCNLRCAYCWAQKKIWNPQKYGTYYKPNEVSEKLIKMNLPIVRVSGGEPTICKNHLLELISLIPENILFVLETNGMLLNESYINELKRFKNIYIRVSLKGVDEKTFEKITGADRKFFKKQLETLDLLKNYDIEHRAAIMFDLFTNEQIKNLRIPNLEFETIFDYPFVMRNLEKRGIKLVRK